MTKNDLPTLRQLARNTNQINYSDHALKQMRSRGYKMDDVEKILTSATNQLVETQPPCGGLRPHRNPRYVISDPAFQPDSAVVIILDLSDPASPEIVVITVESADDTVWSKNRNQDPWLTRIGTMA